jgi:hypothetical protein
LHTDKSEGVRVRFNTIRWFAHARIYNLRHGREGGHPSKPNQISCAYYTRGQTPVFLCWQRKIAACLGGRLRGHNEQKNRRPNPGRVEAQTRRLPRSTAARFLYFLLLVPLLLAGCAQLIDSDAARVCRSLLPVLDRDAETVTVVQSTVTGRTSAVEQAVSIDYQIPGTNHALRRVACLFKAQPPGDPQDPLLGVAALLSAVVTDDGALGPMRLHLLKQNWIARGGASASDPAPYATIGTIPDAPRWLVVTVQHGVSALPIISIYALLAAAYALVYGLVGRINLAFGELTVLAGYGAFLGFTIFGGQNALPGAIAGAVILALYTGASQGLALGRWVLEPLAGRPGQHVLIATSGLSLFWFELMRLTQGSGYRWIGPVFNRPLALLRDGSYVVTVTPMALVLPMIAGACAAFCHASHTLRTPLARILRRSESRRNAWHRSAPPDHDNDVRSLLLRRCRRPPHHALLRRRRLYGRSADGPESPHRRHHRRHRHRPWRATGRRRARHCRNRLVGRVRHRDPRSRHICPAVPPPRRPPRRPAQPPGPVSPSRGTCAQQS